MITPPSVSCLFVFVNLCVPMHLCDLVCIWTCQHVNLFISFTTLLRLSAGLMPDTLYQYQCGDPSISAMSDVNYFRTMPVSGPQSYPSRVAVVGDLGLTFNTTSTVDHMISNHPDLVLLVGDVSYANLYLTNGSGSDCYSCSFSQTPIHETYQPRWDYWGRWISNLFLPLRIIQSIFFPTV